MGVALALADVLRLVVGFVLGVLVALVLAEALALGLAEVLVLAEVLGLAEVLRDGVAEADALPVGSALTEADALPEAGTLADADALPDAFGDSDAADVDAACRADFFLPDFFLAGFFFADFDVVAVRADFGDFAGCAAASSRTAVLGRLAQAPFTMCGAAVPRSRVTEPNTSELVERTSAPATAPSATDLSATALMT